MDIKTKKELDLEREKEYFEYFFSQESKSYRYCYELTEHHFASKYGSGRYSSYESFKNGKGRYLAKLRGK